MAFIWHTISGYLKVLLCYLMCASALVFSASALACDSVEHHANIIVQGAQADYVKETDKLSASQSSSTSSHDCEGECCEGNYKCSALSCSTIWTHISEYTVTLTTILEPKPLQASEYFPTNSSPPLFRPPKHTSS